MVYICKDERSVACSEVVDQILNYGAYKATKYLSDVLTVKATRKMYQGKIQKRARTADIVLTIGKPNYQEREAIKRAKKVGVPLDVTVKFPKVK